MVQYITIHARRGDFADWCGEISRDQCFPPLSAFAQRVFEVQSELRDKHSMEVTNVIMTGNEQDPAWWDSVFELGWLKVDHDKERTVELYGKWCVLVVRTWEGARLTCNIYYAGIPSSWMRLSNREGSASWVRIGRHFLRSQDVE